MGRRLPGPGGRLLVTASLISSCSVAVLEDWVNLCVELQPETRIIETAPNARAPKILIIRASFFQ
jgi:hypothetical protein